MWPLRNYFGDYRYNPFDTFDWMIELDGKVKMTFGGYCEDIYFVIGAAVPDDYTESYIDDNKTKLLLYKLMKKASKLGWIAYQL